jgi:putative ABC transport system permease protein
MLLAESLLLCGASAALGVMSAQAMVAVLARYASRFSVRALDLTVNASLLLVGAALAIVAAVILAFVPRLPSSGTPTRLSLAFLDCHRPKEEACGSPAARSDASGSSR